MMRIRMLFTTRPTKKILELLKENGYRWIPIITCWQKKISYEDERFLNIICDGITLEKLKRVCVIIETNDISNIYNRTVTVDELLKLQKKNVCDICKKCFCYGACNGEEHIEKCSNFISSDYIERITDAKNKIKSEVKNMNRRERQELLKQLYEVAYNSMDMFTDHVEKDQDLKGLTISILTDLDELYNKTLDSFKKERKQLPFDFNVTGLRITREGNNTNYKIYTDIIGVDKLSGITNEFVRVRSSVIRLKVNNDFITGINFNGRYVKELHSWINNPIGINVNSINERVKELGIETSIEQVTEIILNELLDELEDLAELVRPVNDKAEVSL